MTAPQKPYESGLAAGNPPCRCPIVAVLRSRDAELGVWCIETSEPDAAQPTWSKPRRLCDGVVMCKPLALSSGEWVLPISRWREHDESAQCMVSTHAGVTWTRRGGCNVPKDVRQFDEHMFV